MNYNCFEDSRKDFSVITDTHFGRTWKEGVPLNRRGEYEERIYKDFEDFLQHASTRRVIHAGDLFETSNVSNEVLMKVYEIIKKNTRSSTQYYFIAGNHDLPKDSSKVECSSFYILSKLLEGKSNIHFVFHAMYDGEGLLLVPYSHFEDIDEVLMKNVSDSVNCVVGHFDDPVPQLLYEFSGTKISGHFHKRHVTEDGTLFIGSFYPIAFGEESDNSIMETMSLEEYNKRSEEELKDKRVRILLKEGEELPIDHPCLQLIGKKEVKDEIKLDVEVVDNFDFRDLFFDCLKDSDIADELWNRYYTLKGNE